MSPRADGRRVCRLSHGSVRAVAAAAAAGEQQGLHSGMGTTRHTQRLFQHNGRFTSGGMLHASLLLLTSCVLRPRRRRSSLEWR